MSSNNYLLISETDNGFTLVEHCADEVEDNSGFGRGIFPTLKEACEGAQEVMRVEQIEYGVSFNLE